MVKSVGETTFVLEEAKETREEKQDISETVDDPNLYLKYETPLLHFKSYR